MEPSEQLPVNDAQLDHNETQLIATEQTPEKISSRIDEVESDQPELNTKDSEKNAEKQLRSEESGANEVLVRSGIPSANPIPTVKKSGQKRHVSASLVDLSTVPIEAKRPRLDPTPIEFGHGSDAGQQAITTRLQVNSTEKQSMTVGNLPEVGKSDKLTKHRRAASEPPNAIQLPLLSTLFDRFAKGESPTQLLPDMIELMQKQPENVAVQMSCLQLINKFGWLSRVNSSLERKLVEVMLAGLKRYCDNSFIVEAVAKFELAQVFVYYDRVDLYLGSVDVLLDIICDENNMTTSARLATMKLLEKIASYAEAAQSDLIGAKMAVEKICGSIRLQLTKLDSEYYDKIMEVSWGCLKSICFSVANSKRFLSEGGLDLLRQCVKKFNPLVYVNGTLLRLVWHDGTHRLFVYHLGSLLHGLLFNVNAITQDLMANGNLTILWEILCEAKSFEIRSKCAEIFTHFLSNSSISWPLGTPTRVEVQKKLKAEKKGKIVC